MISPSCLLRMPSLAAAERVALARTGAESGDGARTRGDGMQMQDITIYLHVQATPGSPARAIPGDSEQVASAGGRTGRTAHWTPPPQASQWVDSLDALY